MSKKRDPEATSMLIAAVRPSDKGRFVEAAKVARADGIDGITTLTEFVIVACNEKADQIIGGKYKK